jgi:hypothetical protein
MSRRTMLVATAAICFINACGDASPPQPPRDTAPYARDFSTLSNESVVSDGNAWSDWGKTTGSDWDDVGVSNGRAHGVYVRSRLGPYADPTALLSGDWDPDQEAEGVIKGVDALPAGCNQEVELRLRSKISKHSNVGYEVMLQMKSASVTGGGTYISVARWNGALADFTTLVTRSGYNPHDGDRIRASMVGRTLSVYYNDVFQFSVDDGTFATGKPGVGFYVSPFNGNCFGAPASFGFSSYAAREVAP